MSDSDETIRGKLDLQGAANTARELDEEIKKLTGDLKRVNDLQASGSITQKQAAEWTKDLKNQIAQLSGEAAKLKKPLDDVGGGVDQFVNALFKLERGTAMLLSDKGLPRAAGLLESVLAFTGGPSGIGIAIGLIANTINNITPKVKQAMDNLWNSFSPEKAEEARKVMAEIAEKYKQTVDALAKKPAPGTEAAETEKTADINELLNISTLTGSKGIRQTLTDFLMRNKGAVPSPTPATDAERAAQVQETAELNEAVKTRRTGEFERRPEMQVGELVAPMISDKRMREAEATISRIELGIAQRSADKLLGEIGLPGEAGRTAQKQLYELALRNPGILPQGALAKLDRIIHASERLGARADESRAIQEEMTKAAYVAGAPPGSGEGALQQAAFGPPDLRPPQVGPPGNIALGEEASHLARRPGTFAPAPGKTFQNIRAPANPQEAVARLQAEQQRDIEALEIEGKASRRELLESRIAQRNQRINQLSPAQVDKQMNDMAGQIGAVQNVVSTTQQYAQRHTARMSQLHRRTKQLEAANRELQNRQQTAQMNGDQ